MKKIALVVGVIGVFLAYTLVLRHQHGTTNGTTTTSTLSSASDTNTTTTAAGGSTASTTTYKDGTYAGANENAYYGTVQVSATISGGKLISVDFLSYPNDSPNSQDINSQAMPLLKQEAIKAQSAHVDVVSGATMTSDAFAQSLQSALEQAKA